MLLKCVFLFGPVLPGSEGLVVVWFLLLRPSHLFRGFLRPDDLRDAPTPERKSESLTERAPQTGTHTSTHTSTQTCTQTYTQLPLLEISSRLIKKYQ